MTDDYYGMDEACGARCNDGTWGAGCTSQCADLYSKKLSNCDLAAAGMLVRSPHPPRRPGKALL